jgi:perosamine synthetase
MERIPVSGPWITRREVDYVADAAENGWQGRASEYLDRFEAAAARAVGVPHAVALPSCTAALHLALASLGIGPGDEVIVPDLTWIASVAPVVYVGARAVFADVDPATWCLSAESVAARITPRTRAIIAVDLYGGLPDYEAIAQAIEGRDVVLVEDAAEAIGSTLHGRPAGSLGQVGAFSFHGSKTVTTGEGGLFVTRRRDLHARALVLRDHGREPGSKNFWNTEVAYKYRMSNVQAALGLAQLERLDEIVARKREVFASYAEELAGIEGLTLNAEPRGVRNSYWMVTAVLDPGRGLAKEELGRALGERGVDTRPFFYPLSSLPACAQMPDAARAREENVESYRLSPYGVNLPSSPRLTNDDVRRVCRALRDVLGA